MLFLAFTPFNAATEYSEVQEALKAQIPGYVWDLREIGDGNINYIYLADSDAKKILLKKALDYARINPEKFPLSQARLFFEYKAYELYQKICPERVPEIFFYDATHSLLAMEYLSPHIILRKGLLEGKKYPFLAEHLGVFLGSFLYFTSKYHLSKEEWQRNVDLFSQNCEMRRIIESLNFTEPFIGSDLNWWTSPELDEVVSEIQHDAKIKKVVDGLKEKFLNHPEAFCHGDLHTGSILVTERDTRIIDTEFACYAPISFDIGMLLSNFAIAALASPAHNGDSQMLSHLTSSTWDFFEMTFRRLWKESNTIDKKMDEIWEDTLRLMGVEIIRRTIGIAHNADFETISNRKLKASIEKQALQLAKDLILNPEMIPHSKTLEDRLLLEISRMAP